MMPVHVSNAGPIWTVEFTPLQEGKKHQVPGRHLMLDYVHQHVRMTLPMAQYRNYHILAEIRAHPVCSASPHLDHLLLCNLM